MKISNELNKLMVILRFIFRKKSPLGKKESPYPAKLNDMTLHQCFAV